MGLEYSDVRVVDLVQRGGEGLTIGCGLLWCILVEEACRREARQAVDSGVEVVSDGLRVGAEIVEAVVGAVYGWR
jgi:hypothetical protein